MNIIYLLYGSPLTLTSVQDETLQTVGVNPLNSVLSGRGFLIGSRQILQQPVARKLLSCIQRHLEWKKDKELLLQLMDTN